MRIYSWNVNGIRAVLRKDVLLPFLVQHQPDVLGLQEIKARPEQVELELDGYELHWNPAERAGYSGTALLSRAAPIALATELPVEIQQRYRLQDDFGDAHSEGRLQCAEYESFYLVNVYVPNVKGNLDRLGLRSQAWDPALREYLRQLEAHKPVILCGDLNVAHQEIDLARPQENRGKAGFTDQERAGLQAFLDDGLLDSFRLFESGGGHYSWWSHRGGARANNVGWRIDYVLVSSQLQDRLVGAQIHPDVVGSDHCPVSIELDL